MSVTVVPHGINTTIERLDMDLPYLSRSNKLRILYVSSFEPYKHHYKVLSELEKLCEAGYQIDVKFVGAIEKDKIRTLKSWRKYFNPNLKFCWTKEIGQEQLIAEFYKKVDIGIFASTCENLPNVLLEKMRLGLPLFFHNGRPSSDIVGYSEMSFDIYSPGSMSDCIFRCIKNPELLKRNIDRNYKTSLQYDWEITAKKTREVLRSCIQA